MCKSRCLFVCGRIFYGLFQDLQMVKTQDGLWQKSARMTRVLITWDFLVWQNYGKNPRDCLLGKCILEPSHDLYCIFLREHGIHKELTHDRNATAFDTLLHKILLWIQSNGTNYTYISSFFLEDKTLPMMSSPGSISSSPSVQHLQPALQNHAGFGKKGMD